MLLTHNDLDGISCGILAKIAFKEDVEVQYHSVNSLDYAVEKFLQIHSEGNLDRTKLYITDLSVHQENAKRLNEYVKKGGQVILIDHHKSALHLNNYSWASVSVEEPNGGLASATSLFYEYLIKSKALESSKILDEYVELVRQYDTWEWDKNNNTQAKQLNDLLFLQSIEDFEESISNRIHDQERFTFSDFEVKLLEMEENKRDRYIRKKKRETLQVNITDACVGVVYAEAYHSELGNELGKEYSHLDAIVILNMGNRKVSFRTIHEDIDVSEIAATFGGGGHAKAAGCSLTKEAYKQFVEKTFLLKPLRVDATHNELNQKTNCTHYQNNEKDQFFLYHSNTGKWIIEKNHKELEDHFETRELAERFIKRSYSANLSKDEQLINYLYDSYNRNQME
ncbi:DHH family phosphoesterase [Metabacillus sp. HB246100]